MGAYNHATCDVIAARTAVMPPRFLRCEMCLVFSGETTGYQNLPDRWICATQSLIIPKTTVYMEGSKFFTFIYMQNLKITRW